MKARSRQAFCAAAVVGAIVASIPLVEAAGEAVSWISVVSRSAATLVDTGFDGEEGREDVFMQSVQGFSAGLDVRVGSEEVPRSFSEECLAMGRRQDVVVSAEGALVGFSDDGSPERVFSSLSEELCSKGWTLLESGSDTQASFVKDAGTYRWLYVSCIQMSGATSVVIQCA